MSKLSQLQVIRSLGLPVPPFTSVQYEDFRSGEWPVPNLRFPLIVRSSYFDEDGATSSQAGQYESVLRVSQEELPNALQRVFDSYPDPTGSEVILQEMIEPVYSGVLFAYHRACWKLELSEGQGEALVSGHQSGLLLLLPRFQPADVRWVPWYPFEEAAVNRKLIELSAKAGKLLRHLEAEYGLDIEFCWTKEQLYLLQARPITTPEEAEEVLTSANHKEILPPQPSALMTDIISQSGPALYDYYRSLDGSLPERSFILPAAGMPWLNLSALLDTMVHWGLPSALVCRSVGAEDFYRVGLRPLRLLTKLPVFLRLLRGQWGIGRRLEQWQVRMAKTVGRQRAERQAQWTTDPATAFETWLTDFQQLYVQLVTYMQQLTGAMSGPVGLLEKLGLLGAISVQGGSQSSDYYRAFQRLSAGQVEREAFLEQFGHRGFYESDIGQRRFWEYTEAEWEQLLQGESNAPPASRRAPFWVALFRPVVRLIHLREALRHETMKWFWSFRQELIQQTAVDSPWRYTTAQLSTIFEGADPSSFPLPPPPSGWDMDTFLCNGHGRRLPLSVLTNVASAGSARQAIGIYPGVVEGQVWRVKSADLGQVTPPDYPSVILVTDALDPGWVPYFSKVDGVISYVGGLLSHASIVLREAGLPSITQLPANVELREGEWIKMDGKSGEVSRRSEPISNG